MSRLPTPGSDSGTWGDILNDYLSQSLNADGTLKAIPQSKVTGLGAIQTKLDTIETSATADQTAAEILAALQTVDGSGSGLDADLLDGQQATAFSPVAQVINAQIGTTYVIVAADTNKLVTLDNGSGIQVTLPQDSDATIAIGAYVDFLQLGVGQVTVVAGTGATLRISGFTAKSRAQYSRLGAQKVSANTWSLFGDLAAS